MALLGNHAGMMLDYLDGRQPRFDWLPFGGDVTLDSYQSSGDDVAIDAKHLDYIRTWQDCFEHDTHFFVHGGYDYRRSLNEQDWNSWRRHSLRQYVPPPHISGNSAVVGHTSLNGANPLDLGHIICVDTYCYGGGRLTALDIITGHVWQTDRDGGKVQRADSLHHCQLFNGER